MKASEAEKLYNENWDKEFTTMEDLYVRIKTLAENGAYECCVYVDDVSTFNGVMAELRLNGYDLADNHDGGTDGPGGVIEINFC